MCRKPDGSRSGEGSVDAPHSSVGPNSQLTVGVSFGYPLAEPKSAGIGFLCERAISRDCYENPDPAPLKPELFQDWIHADRVIGGDRHNCHPRRPVAAGLGQSQDESPRNFLPEQQPAVDVGLATAV